MVPQPDPLLREWHPREAQPCSWAAAGASPTQRVPLRAALAVVSLLRWVKVTVPAPATLQAVMWYPSSGFSLWSPGSHGLGTTHRSATRGRREERKKTKGLTKSAAQLQCWTWPTLPQTLTPVHVPVLQGCGKMAKGPHGLDGRCACASRIPKNCETGRREQHLWQQSTIRMRTAVAPLTQLKEALSPAPRPDSGVFCNPPPPTS